MQNAVQLKEVIITTLTTRGKGIHPDPVRAITQIWEKDGRLIAEVDPCGQSEIERKYNELIMAVSSAEPGESRHERALSYIKQAEEPATTTSAEALPDAVLFNEQRKNQEYPKF